jgi:HTH-type transcriptional regulator/antitoxin HigA
LAEVRKRGWLPDTDDLDTLEQHVLHFLEIETLDDRPRFEVAAKRANCTEPITLEQTAWLAHVRAVASTRDVPSFDRSRLDRTAAALPKALQGGPTLLRDVPRLLAECGVVLVISEGLRGGKLDGAVTFLSDGTPVVGLTTRGDRFDGVLFTLLHECAHLVLGHLKPGDQAIVDDDVNELQTDPNEVAANDQASYWLFPKGFELASTTVPAIVHAAGVYEVHPSVVLGRVQRERNDWKLHRSLVPKVRSLLAEQGVLS